MNLVTRSNKQELLDEDTIPFADIRQNMKELDFINRWLGGHQITIAAFRQLIGNKKKVVICEIGCGGGDNLIAINRWCKKRQVKLVAIGVDIKQECIDFANTRAHDLPSVKWITSDYKKVVFENQPDIIFSSLFCHHFTNEQLVFQLKWMRENSQTGFFINDLQRNKLAYYSIKYLTRLFSKSYLVKNDAPLSVARGFTRVELQALCREAEIEGARIIWKWAFRYLVIFRYEG